MRGARLAVALRVAVALIGGLLISGASAAYAEDRYAILIGSNRGEPDEGALRFAERDAQRVADVLVRLGGVAPEDLIVLPTPSRAVVTRALATLRGRIRDPAGALVVVYYSGHADAQALHLSGERLGFSELKADVRALGAEVSLFVVDACRSGGLVRSKGGTPTDETFDFDVQDRLASEGVAIITSSAADEDAQESDHLSGGVFTHHLVTGLLGAADESRDARVSLGEAYRYAYSQTLASTSTSRIVQHPSYRFDISGREEIVLTRLGSSDERGRVRFEAGGHYLVLEAIGLPQVVAELEAGDGVELSLLPGKYVIRRRETAAVFESRLAVAARATTAIAVQAMERVPFRHAVRKGYGLTVRRALSLGLDAELAGPLLDGTGLLVGGAITGQLDWADLALRARVRFATSSSQNDHVALSQNLLGVDFGIYHVFDLDQHGVGFGLRAGADWLGQRFESRGDAPDGDQLVGRVGPFGRIELALGGSFALQIDAGAEIYLLSVAKNATGSRSAIEARVVPTVTVGGSFAL